MKRRTRRLVFAAAALIGAGSVGAQTQGDAAPAATAVEAPEAVAASWSLSIPSGEHVTYRGVTDLSAVGAADGGMLYPAPDAATAIVALVTHAILVDSAQRSQKSALEEAADKVLDPYRGVLDGYTPAELMARSMGKISISGDKRLLRAPRSSGERRVDSTPVFSLTQDQRAIVLDNAVSVPARDGDADAGYTRAVRVVSPPVAAADPAAYWLSGNGERLKEESAVLLAASLDIALGARNADLDAGDATYRTVRYPQGGTEKMERAQVLGEYCERVLLRTLRGDLMLVPVRHHPGLPADGAAAIACQDPLPAALAGG